MKLVFSLCPRDPRGSQGTILRRSPVLGVGDSFDNKVSLKRKEEERIKPQAEQIMALVGIEGGLRSTVLGGKRPVLTAAPTGFHRRTPALPKPGPALRRQRPALCHLYMG